MPIIESSVINTGLWLWKHAVNQYNSRQLAEEFEAIHKRITDVYSDMATAHFKAAIDALLASEHSTSPELEIRASISHMVEAFRVFEQASHKRVKHRFLIFFADEEYMIEDREAVHQCLAHWAALIAIMYASLKEPKNSGKWKQLASEEFAKYSEYITFSPEALQIIDNKYARKFQVEEFHPGWVDGDPGYHDTHDDLEISPQGFEYIEKFRLDIRKQFAKRIDNARVCITR